MAQKKTYSPPSIKVEGKLEELTLLIPKHTNHTPDGYSFGGIVLTS